MATDVLQTLEAAAARIAQALRAGDLDAMLPALRDGLDLLARMAHDGLVPRSAQPPAPWDGAAAEQRLWQLLSQAHAAGCSVFPFAGTLLGLERDGRLLPNDKDADLAVWLEDFGLACVLLQNLGLQRAANVPPFGNMAAFIDPATGGSVDLFGLRRDPVQGRIEGGVWMYGKPPSHQRVLHIPWFVLAPRALSNGARLWWPQPADALLTALYGNWRRPQPEWDSLVSCVSVTQINLHWHCWALKQLFDRWLTGDLGRTRRLWDQVAARTEVDADLARWRDALDAALALAQKARAP
jgi:hypothetical protein